MNHVLNFVAYTPNSSRLDTRLFASVVTFYITVKIYPCSPVCFAVLEREQNPERKNSLYSIVYHTIVQAAER